MGTVLSAITSVVALCTALSTLTVSLLVLRSSRQVAHKVDGVATASLVYQEDLRKALTDARVTVPPDKSLAP